jgi:NAD+ diphosphatase
MLSRSAVRILQYRYLFSGITVLVSRDSLDLPNEALVRRCLDNQLASDWFCEPALDYTTLMLEDDAPELSGYRWIPLREYFAGGKPDVPRATRAMSLLKWRRNTRFCGTCGGALHDSTEETARKCILCGRIVFPTIEPAVIVLVRREGELLLARHAQRNTNVFTCLAGFVEQGETIEQCVVREIREETGIEIKNLRYVGSQSWPFPDQLMLAFKADWASGEPTPDKTEIAELRWFKQDALPSIPPRGSVAYRLIMDKE